MSIEIRPYQAEDDPQLLQLEKQSPRGFPNPFVHFRRRFIDRAELYPQSLTLVAVEQGKVIGVSSVALKETFIGGQAVKVAYTFDSRVAPTHRRHGIGHALVEEKLKWAKNQGALGCYSLILATNQASLGMVAKSGYKKARLILHLEYTPYPLMDTPPFTAECTSTPIDHDLIDATFYPRDLYIPNLAERVQHLDYQRWHIRDDQDNYAALSVFNQSMVYTQISADDPWPRTETDIQRLGRNLQVFDEVGMHNGKLVHALFDWLRDDAIVTNVNHLTWLVDRADPIPQFLLADASYQKDYWLLFKSFYADWEPAWSERLYLDPRDL